MPTEERPDMRHSLGERFAEFKTQIGRLPEDREPPSTTLQILGISRQERAWQALLFHFLSPDEPHGLDHSLLEHFLTALSNRDDITYEFSRFDLDDVQLETEVVTSDNRRPDAILWSTDNWFICFELKVGAAEGNDQTTDYVDVRSFAGINLDKQTVPDEGHYYIYLAPGDAPAPKAAEFVPISWKWIAAELQSFLAASHGEYPARTTAQLSDFIATIKSELTMTRYRENQEEKAELYFKYYDEIGAAREAFESRWEEFEDNWGGRLAGAIECAEIREVPDLDTNHIAIELANSAGDRDRWFFRQGESDWAGIIKEGWWRHKDDLSLIYPQQEREEDVRISLYHRLKQNRNLAIGESTLELQWWHGSGNGDEFMYSFKDNLYPKMEAADRVIPPAIEMTGRRGNFLIATYDIPVGEHSKFFDAYIEALRSGFIDLAVENEFLIGFIDEAFEETLEMFE